jgi:titin
MAFSRRIPQWLGARIRARTTRSLKPIRRLQFEPLEPYILMSYLVTNGNDNGPGSLTQAILDANSQGGGTIAFEINGGGAATIATAGLPSLTARVVLDATTQPGYAGKPLITIQGPGDSGSGLTLEPGAKGSSVLGLTIRGFANGMVLDSSGGNTIEGNVISGNAGNGLILSGPGASRNQIIGNLIGTDPSGQTSMINLGYGMIVSDGASDNTIGGTAAGTGNVISGNAYSGITIRDPGTTRNLLEGNLIGVNATAASALGNENEGIDLADGATATTIGGTAAGAGNVIAGNGYDGILISDPNTSGTVIEGNLIGTNSAATSALGNGENGVHIAAGASSNTVGGTAPGARNVISGNGYDGIVIHDPTTLGNVIEGNLIGTDATGARALGNIGNGVEVFAGAGNTTIGGPSPAARNIISGNRHDGVTLRSGATHVLVAGNVIGADITGSSALPNSANGVDFYFGATANTVGGTSAAAANVISGNNELGVSLSDSGTSGNLIEGNLIGTDATGLVGVPNGNLGVGIVNGASGNAIGGTTPAAGNIISGNVLNGVVLTDHGTSGNLIAGNFIGTDASGAVAIGNGGYGIVVFNGASSNTIGGTSSSAGNVISGNGYSGMELAGTDTSKNLIEGNLIGTDKSGTTALANANDGIVLSTGASNNTIGGTTGAAANVISSSPYDGIAMGDTGTSGNLIEGNLIGTDKSGTNALPNEEGINIYGGATNNTIGGTSAGAGNVLSGNSDNGVDIHDQGTSGNLIDGNFIGTGPGGSRAIPNQGDGVLDTNSASNNSIGGTVAGAGNTIAYNVGNGVAVGQDPNDRLDGVAVNNNVIFANVQLGIDLIDDGPTPNTLGGPHAGPNELQNFPVLTAATTDGTTVTIQGTLNSMPNATFRLEFYANPARDPSGYGQGQTALGALTVTTDARGNASFVARFTAKLLAGQFVSATATDANGDTSEFSLDQPVT